MLTQRKRAYRKFPVSPWNLEVPRDRIELPTRGFSGSTSEFRNFLSLFIMPISLALSFLSFCWICVILTDFIWVFTHKVTHKNPDLGLLNIETRDRLIHSLSMCLMQWCRRGYLFFSLAFINLINKARIRKRFIFGCRLEDLPTDDRLQSWIEVARVRLIAVMLRVGLCCMYLLLVFDL